MHKKWLVCFLTFVLAACGKSDDPSGTKKSVPLHDAKNEVSALLPANAIAVIHLKSCDAIVDLMTRFGKLVDEPVPPEPLAMAGAQFGFDHTKVDRSQPVAIAIGLMGGMQPLPTVILPATDPVALKQSFAQGASAVEGNYVALSMAPDYKPGAAPEKLTQALPVADAVMRVDLAGIMKVSGPMIEGGLAFAESMAGQQMAQVPGVDVANVMSELFGWARDFLQSAETLDVFGSMPSGTLDVRMVFTAKEGSPLAQPGPEAKLADLAGHLGGDYPLALLFNMDVKWWMDLVKQMSGAMAAEMPEEARAAFIKSMADMDKYAKYMGNDWAMGLHIGSEGFRAAGAMTSPDPDGYMRTALEVMKENDPAALGMNITNEGERDVKGTKVLRFRMKIDPEKFGQAQNIPPEQAAAVSGAVFGANGSLMDIAAMGDRVVFAMSRDGSEIDAALGDATPPAGVRNALNATPGNLTFLVHVDLRTLVKGGADFARAMGGQRVPSVPAGGPVPLSLVGSRDGRTFHMALAIDVAGTKEVVKAID